jgi:hypothetical protein
MNNKKTHWKKLTNPNYLGSYALTPGEDLIITIDYVAQEDVYSPQGGDEECTVAHFKENVKPLILNVTNARQIEKIYGTPYIEEWAGKKIQIYIADNIQAFGKTVSGLRIRPKKPQTTKPELTPDGSKWEAAVENVANQNTTIQAIRKHYSLSDESEKQLLDEAESYQTQEVA